MLLSPLYSRWGNWNSERLNDLFRVTQLTIAKGAGPKPKFSMFKCYALSTQTSWAISACDITPLLSAALNKDCFYSGVTCLGGEPSGNQEAVIKNYLCWWNCLCSFSGDTEILFPVIIQGPLHSYHTSGFNVNNAFPYKQFVVKSRVSQWLVGWWPAGRRWRRGNLRRGRNEGKAAQGDRKEEGVRR